MTLKAIPTMEAVELSILDKRIRKGSRVFCWFKGQQVIGTVQRINRKTVSIGFQDEDGNGWYRLFPKGEVAFAE